MLEEPILYSDLKSRRASTPVDHSLVLVSSICMEKAWTSVFKCSTVSGKLSWSLVVSVKLSTYEAIFTVGHRKLNHRSRIQLNSIMPNTLMPHPSAIPVVLETPMLWLPRIRKCLCIDPTKPHQAVRML